MKGTVFAFGFSQLLYYIYHKISQNRVGPYVNSPEWIKNEKATINPIKKTINVFNTL